MGQSAIWQSIQAANRIKRSRLVYEVLGKQGGGSPQSIYSQSSQSQDGDAMFSKGHFVKGIEARNIMTDTKRFGYPKFKTELMRQLRDYMANTATAIGV